MIRRIFVFFLLVGGLGFVGVGWYYGTRSTILAEFQDIKEELWWRITQKQYDYKDTVFEAKAVALPGFMAGVGGPENFFYRQDQQEIIDQLAEYGGNALEVRAVLSHGGDGGPQANPFVRHDPSEKIDESVLEEWEGWLEQLEEHDIMVLFFLYDDGIKIRAKEVGLGWRLDSEGKLHPQERAFIEKLVNRFEHHENIIWVVMEQVSEMSAGLLWTDEYILHAKKIAEAIRSTDESNHPIGIHTSFLSDLEVFADDANIDMMLLKRPGDPEEVKRVVQEWGARYSIVYSQVPVSIDLLQGGSRQELQELHRQIARAGASFTMFGTWEPYYGGIVPTPEILGDLRELQQYVQENNRVD